MIVFITGATGFLGREILNEFDLKKNIVIINSEDLSQSIPVIPSIDLVIHVAGKAHFVPKTVLEKQIFFDVNVTGTRNLLKGLANSAYTPQQFVFISSVAVYGIESGTLISENTPLFAKDAYGKSKVEAEVLVQQWCKLNNVVCTILRLPLLAGSNPPGNLGAMIRGIRKGYYFNIAGGKAKKSMVLAEDIAKAIPIVSKIGGIYNLTDRCHPNFEELSENIAQQLNKNKPYNMPLTVAKIIAQLGDLIGTKAPLNSKKLNKIISNLTFDDTKAVRTFGWNPTPVLQGFKIY